MNHQQVQLVQNSYESVKPISDVAADLFYGRLFELDPTLRHYFKGDLKEQKTKLMQTLAFVVAGLDKFDAIVPAVQALGERHVGYGIQPFHYETVGSALLWTLAQGLQEQFTTEVEQAWIAAYGLLATTMIEAAEVAS